MGVNDQFALQKSWAAHVRFGSKADIPLRRCDVRFTPNSGHRGQTVGCLLCAKSGLLQRSKKASLFNQLIRAVKQLRRDGQTKRFCGL